MSSTLPRSNPRSPEGFEAFYKDVRGRLLLQSYALTGDLVAAQRAVRDAMVGAFAAHRIEADKWIVAVQSGGAHVVSSE